VQNGGRQQILCMHLFSHRTSGADERFLMKNEAACKRQFFLIN